MPATIGLERTADKWVRRAGVARPDYEAGIDKPKRTWMAATIAAKKTFREAITAPEIPEMYAAGARAAGDEKWSAMAKGKGADRYSKGVELGEPYYRARMGNVLGVIEKTVLPVRGPAGSEKNWERSRKMGMELRAWKLARKGPVSIGK